MVRICILILFLMLALHAGAQLMPFKNYGSGDGLSDNNVQAVIRDDRGLLWVGTDFGLYWFDGKKFYQPKIQTKIGQLYVTGFYKDHEGTIWVLTFFNGIYKYKNGVFTNYFIDNGLRKSASNPVSEMLQLADNKYIVLVDDCPYIFNGRSFTKFDPGNPFLKTQVNSVAIMHDGRVLFGTQDGLIVYNYFSGEPGLSGVFFKNYAIKKLLIVSDKIWLLTNTGLLEYNEFKNNEQPVFLKSFLKQSNIRSISANKNGSIWAFSDNGTMWTTIDTAYKIKDQHVSKYLIRNGLPENIQQVYCDNEGLVWFAHRKGICLLGDEYYEFNSLKNGNISTPVTALAADEKNQIWLGTLNGIFLKDDQYFKSIKYLNKRPIGYVSWFKQSPDSPVFAGTDLGELIITNKTVKPGANVISTATGFEIKGKTWYGDLLGRIWYNNNNSITKIKTNYPISEMIAGIQPFKNFLWVGYRDRGVVRYRIKNDSVLFDKEYTQATGFEDIRVRSCVLDNKGNIIWGTRTNGVFVFSASTGLFVSHITKINGLNANWVKGMYYDAKGQLYMATNNGINVLYGNYKKPVIKHVIINNENINRETNCILKVDNIFYIGTNEGILKWIPGALHKEEVAPPVYFTNISIPGKKSFSISPFSTQFKKIRLPDDLHFITFEFSGVSLKNPENIRYRYILEGQDSEWNPLTEHNNVSFNLKPGDYTFKVLAINGNGVWSKQAAIFHFIITPPFWESWWFILLLVAAAFYVIYLGYRYKIGKILAIELLRNKISTDLHDDIGSTLSSISILSEVGKHENEARSKKILSEINERSLLLMEKMDDIVWSISSQNDTLGNLLARIQIFASTVFEAKDIEYEFNISEKIKIKKLDMQQRQHIYLILKEGINNLIKYSGCTMACVKAAYFAGMLTIEVADNGTGFDIKNILPGNGLYNMQKRAKTIGGKLEINSVPKQGTVLVLTVYIE